MRGIIKKALGSAPLTRFAAHFGPARVAVLCYHDVRDDDDFESWMRVGVSHFARQLEGFGRVGRFISPTDLSTPMQLNASGLNFMVTFDDGYVNNRRLALPVLERMGIPALFFVSTEHMQSGRPFWSDLVITPLQLLDLESLDLTEHGLREYRFRREPAVRWEDIDEVLRDLKRVGNENHPTVKAVLEDLQTRFGERIAVHLDRYRPLDEMELRAMGDSPLVHLGSHAHLHEILTYLSDEQLAYSLRESRQILEAITDAPVTHIAYPNGDADDRVIAATRDAGYDHGYFTRGGLVGPAQDTLRLPRIMVGGYDSLDVTRFLINRHLLVERF